jgi:hypothetical protein
VHCDIDLAGEQRILDFLDEQPLAADLRQRRFGKPVPEFDSDDFAIDDQLSRAAAPLRRWPGKARARCRAYRHEGS